MPIRAVVVAASTIGNVEPNHLMRVVEPLFTIEPRPVMASLVEIPRGDTPIEQAFTGLCLAVNAVIEADHQQHLRDWRERRDQLLEWRAPLAAHPIPDIDSAASGVVSGDITVTQALFGTERWDEMFDDLQEMLEWSAEQLRESARKASALGEVLNRAPGVRRRGDERVNQVIKSAERKLHDGNSEACERIIEAGHREVQTISAVAVKRTNGFTRQVLDLDEDTAAIATRDWLRQHGLDTQET